MAHVRELISQSCEAAADSRSVETAEDDDGHPEVRRPLRQLVVSPRQAFWRDQVPHRATEHVFPPQHEDRRHCPEGFLQEVVEGLQVLRRPAATNNARSGHPQPLAMLSQRPRDELQRTTSNSEDKGTNSARSGRPSGSLCPAGLRAEESRQETSRSSES